MYHELDALNFKLTPFAVNYFKPPGEKITHIEGYTEMNEHVNTTLIQELFELTAERFIELEGNVEEGELELLNSLIDVLFFE